MILDYIEIKKEQTRNKVELAGLQRIMSMEKELKALEKRYKELCDENQELEKMAAGGLGLEKVSTLCCKVLIFVL